MGFPGGSVVKNPPANAGYWGFDPQVGKIPWRSKWQPTAVFLPGKSHGERSLLGYSPFACKELDMSERLNNNNLILWTEKGEARSTDRNRRLYERWFPNSPLT